MPIYYCKGSRILRRENKWRAHNYCDVIKPAIRKAEVIDLVIVVKSIDFRYSNCMLSEFWINR